MCIGLSEDRGNRLAKISQRKPGWQDGSEIDKRWAERFVLLRIVVCDFEDAIGAREIKRSSQVLCRVHQGEFVSKSLHQQAGQVRALRRLRF